MTHPNVHAYVELNVIPGKSLVTAVWHQLLFGRDSSEDGTFDITMTELYKELATKGSPIISKYAWLYTPVHYRISDLSGQLLTSESFIFLTAIAEGGPWASDWA